MYTSATKVRVWMISEPNLCGYADIRIALLPFLLGPRLWRQGWGSTHSVLSKEPAGYRHGAMLYKTSVLWMGWILLVKVVKFVRTLQNHFRICDDDNRQKASTTTTYHSDDCNACHYSIGLPGQTYVTQQSVADAEPWRRTLR
jgi:hypothetical protein